MSRVYFLLVLVVTTLCACNDQADLSSFMSAEFAPYPNDFEDVDLDKRYYDNLPRAMKAYELREWEEAQIFLREYRKLFRAYQEVDFFLANAYLGSGDVERAGQLFDSITGECDYYAQALWYRTLILVHQQDWQGAAKLLASFQLIAEQHDFKVSEAVTLADLVASQLG